MLLELTAPLIGEEPFIGAEGRGRTDTNLAAHWILSPARLPIPPLRHAKIIQLKYFLIKCYHINVINYHSKYN